MSSEAINGRKRLGTILLLLSAVPSALFGVGLTLGGLCMIPEISTLHHFSFSA